MKTILSSIASAATLYLTNTAYTTDIFMDNLNHNYTDHPSHIKNNQDIIDQQFHERGFIIDRFHTHKELEYLTETISIRANEKMNSYCKKHAQDRHIQEYYMSGRTKFQLTWKQHDTSGETLASVGDIYKIHLSGLKSSRNNTMLNSIAKLMQCETDKILHMKNDMILDYWSYYEESNPYSTNCYHDIWPNNKDNINYIQTFTLLNDSATVHVWQSDLKMNGIDRNNRAEAERLKKTTKPDVSFKIGYGDTVLMNPYVEFSVKDEKSFDKICFLVNEYARYNERLYKMSINKNVFTINSVDVEKVSYDTFHQQGFILSQTHGSGEFVILRSLVRDICNLASEEAKRLQKIEQKKNKGSDQKVFDIVMKKNDQETSSGKWGASKGVEGYVKDVYKHHSYILDFVQNNKVLATVAKMFGCKVQEVLHVRNDVVSDQWMKINNNDILNEFGLYKINQCNERDEYDKWQYITAITSLGADVDLHIWSDSKIMSIGNDQKNHRNQARAYRKANKATYSMPLKAGHTVFITPFAEYAVTPREKLDKKVLFYVNGFAYPGTCKVEKSKIDLQAQFMHRNRINFVFFSLIYISIGPTRISNGKNIK